MRNVSFSDSRTLPVCLYDIDVDDLGLNPFEHRAYMRIVRRAAGGQSACTESLENMANACRMSRSSLALAIKSLLRRRMIRRVSKIGHTSEYTLLDKSMWVSPPVGEVSATRTGGVRHTDRGCPPHGQGVSATRTGGVRHTDTKIIHEEYKERERREDAPASPSRSLSPSSNSNLDFETPFNGMETEGDDLSPNLPPLAEAIRKAIAWPECLSPKQYQVLLSAVKDLGRYNGQVSADVLSKAADFYRDQKGGRTWHPSFLANDWPFLKQWYDSRFGRKGGSAPSSNPSSRRVDSSCRCGGTGRIRVGFEEIDLGGGRGVRRLPVSDFCTCVAGQSAKSAAGAPAAML